MGFWLCCRIIFYITEFIEAHKISEAFCAKLICKMSDVFYQFLLALGFSAKKSEIKRPNMRSRITSFWSKFRFLETILGCFR